MGQHDSSLTPEESMKHVGYTGQLDVDGQPTQWWVSPEGDVVSDWISRECDRPLFAIEAAELSDNIVLVKLRSDDSAISVRLWTFQMPVPNENT